MRVRYQQGYLRLGHRGQPINLYNLCGFPLISRHQNHLLRESLADRGLDSGIAILIPSFKLRQDNSILA